jgi:GxxExxY protein
MNYQLTHEIIGAAIEVHRELGAGKTELQYELALAHELSLRGFACQRQKPVPVIYKGMKLECGYRLDILANEAVVIEVKSVEAVIPIHRAQTLTYIKLGGWAVALMLNFNVAALKDGIERFVTGPSKNITTNNSPAPAGAICSENPADCSWDEGCETLANETINAAMEVHRELGPGLLPSTYEECLCYELSLRGIPFERRYPLALQYKGAPLAEPHEVQLVVGGKVVVSALALAEVRDVHPAQLLSQLRLGNWPLGLLFNFNALTLKQDLRRLTHRTH